MSEREQMSKTRVLNVIWKAQDLETHVRSVEVEGVRVLEFRDYIPSLEAYGRGYWIPIENKSALNDIADSIIGEINA
jgi:hypothetical protein